MTQNDFKSAQFATLHNSITADLGLQIEKLEYEQWQEEYRRLVFAKEIRVSHTEPPLSRRARRRQRNKAKWNGYVHHQKNRPRRRLCN